MTNITLSIDDAVYRGMKEYSEIKWSEFVRKAIEKRVQELARLKKSKSQESVLTMLASEETLKKEWGNEADERWNNV